MHTFESFIIKKSEKLPLIWHQTCLDMRSIFGVKLNYFVIFETLFNFCLLQPINGPSMICDQLFFPRLIFLSFQ